MAENRSFSDDNIPTKADDYHGLAEYVRTQPNVAAQGVKSINVEMTFESMDDFSPAAVARKVDSLNKILTARTQLSNLLTYMDGKGGAEELVGKLLSDPALLQAVSAAPKPTEPPK